MTLKMPCDLVLYDLETNAKDYPDVEITQIGAQRLKADTLEVVDSFNSYVKVKELTERSIEITGITYETLKDAQPFEVVGKEFVRWANQPSTQFIPAAWGTHFDIPVFRWLSLKHFGKMLLPGKSFCVKTTMYNFFWLRGVPVYRCSVETAMKILGREFDGKAHDALDDVKNEAFCLRTALGVEKSLPQAQVKFGNWTKTLGNVPIGPLGIDDQESPYDRKEGKTT